MTVTPPAPTVTTMVDASPCPRAEVVVSPMPSDADQLTVWRSWSGQRRVLRDARAVTVAGSSVVIDPEVPFGVPVTYSCQTIDSAGTPSQLSPSSSAVVVSVGQVWLQDPLDPTSALRVSLGNDNDKVLLPGLTLLPSPSLLPQSGDPSLANLPMVRRDAFRQASYARQTTLAAVPGSEFPMAFTDVSQAASGIPFAVRAVGEDAISQLLALLRQAYPLCIRTGTNVPLMPGLAYLGFDQIDRADSLDMQTVYLSSTGTSVLPPGGPTVVSSRTIDSLGDEADTINGLGQLYDTILDLERGRAS